jgi:putative transposase
MDEDVLRRLIHNQRESLPMKRVSGGEATRKRIAELVNSEGFDLSEMMRTGVRLMIDQALEAEVEKALGHQRYERSGEPAKGYRNGLRTSRIKTAEGVVDFAVPQVTGTPEPFVSRVRQALPERTEELGRLAIEMYARGLSMWTLRRLSPTNKAAVR